MIFYLACISEKLITDSGMINGTHNQMPLHALLQALSTSADVSYICVCCPTDEGPYMLNSIEEGPSMFSGT